MKNKCPKSWSDLETRSKCENPDVVADPFGSMPVTNVENGFTFSNVYCALCNQDSGDKQVPISVDLKC